MSKLVAATLTIALACSLQVSVLASPRTMLTSDEAQGAQQNVRRAKKKVQDVKCIASLEDIQYLGPPSGPHQQWLCELHTDSVEKVTGKKMGRGQMKKIEGFEEYIKAHSKEVVSSHTTIVLSEVDVDDAEGTIKIPPGKAIGIENGNGNGNGNGNNGNGNGTNKRGLAVTGERTVLVLRINAQDKNTTSSATTLSEKVFGTNDANLATGYDSCSNGELKFVKATHSRVTNGVYEVTIPDTVNLNENSVIRNAAIAKAVVELGDLSSQFNHVMVCIPPGTIGTWIAYGYVNSYMTVYNNQWCTYMSAQMHEVGHNLGLAHSNEGGNVYADQSGMMGFSYSMDNGPMMCFNGAKSWQLGWYADRREIVDPIESPWETRKLVGVAEYDQSVAGEHYVVVKMEAGLTDYYVAFNRKAGINSGNAEVGADNHVMVTTQGDNYSESNLEAKLGAGEEFTIQDFNGSGEDVVVVVHSIDTASSPSYALVSIFVPSSLTISPAPTPAPSSCGNGGRIHIAVTTDKYPHETSWTLTGTTNLEGNEYAVQNQEFVTEQCIEAGAYVFTIEDSYGDGNCCTYGNGGITVMLDSEAVYSRPGDYGEIDTFTFSVGSSTPSPVSPTPNPVIGPTTSPVTAPPTDRPTLPPTESPVTSPPTRAPTDPPTQAPVTSPPTRSPVTAPPTDRPTLPPTQSPVNPTPTRAPTDPPTTSPTVTYVCADDPKWKRTEKKGKVVTCTWVGEKPNARCNKMGDDGELSNIGCPETCGVCTN